MAKKFNMVLGLHINPDFSEVEAGRALPPRVNHDKVDFGLLRAALKEAFFYGQSQEILVANDTIDQVTAHMRFGMVPGVAAAPTEDLMACRDFGVAMLGLVGSQSDGIIDVRKAWETKHVAPVRDRSYAPPPVLIPFVVVSANFHEAMSFIGNTRAALSLEPFDVFGDDDEDIERLGTLSDDLRANLQDIFGCPFIAHAAMLDRMATDKPPAWVTQN